MRDETITSNIAERLQHRAEQIKRILHFEFPGSHAPPPPSTLPTASTTSESIARKQLRDEFLQHRLDAIEARRAELSTLTADQLATVFMQKWSEWSEQDRRRREKQTPRAYEPEAQHWAHPAELELELIAGALLLVNIELRTGLGLHLKSMLRGECDDGRYVREDQTPEGLSDEARAKLNTVNDILRRARMASRNGLLKIDHEKVNRREFLTWASENGYPPPSESFASLIDAASSSHDLVTGKQPLPTTQVASSRAAAPTAPAKGRHDVLSPVIERLVQETDGRSAQAVWLKLRDMALAKKQPFTGETKGDALIYLNADNVSKGFTARNLRDRMRRRVARSPANTR